ncbi:hypothetical protein JCM3775_002729 [Rhodotorula graminis]
MTRPPSTSPNAPRSRSSTARAPDQPTAAELPTAKTNKIPADSSTRSTSGRTQESRAARASSSGGPAGEGEVGEGAAGGASSAGVGAAQSVSGRGEGQQEEQSDNDEGADDADLDDVSVLGDDEALGDDEDEDVEPPSPEADAAFFAKHTAPLVQAYLDKCETAAELPEHLRIWLQVQRREYLQHADMWKLVSSSLNSAILLLERQGDWASMSFDRFYQEVCKIKLSNGTQVEILKAGVSFVYALITNANIYKAYKPILQCETDDQLLAFAVKWKVLLKNAPELSTFGHAAVYVLSAKERRYAGYTFITGTSRCAAHETTPISEKMRKARKEVPWAEWKKQVIFTVPAAVSNDAGPALFLVIEHLVITTNDLTNGIGLNTRPFDSHSWRFKYSKQNIIDALEKTISLCDTLGTTISPTFFEDNLASFRTIADFNAVSLHGIITGARWTFFMRKQNVPAHIFKHGRLPMPYLPREERVARRAALKAAGEREGIELERGAYDEVQRARKVRKEAGAVKPHAERQVKAGPGGLDTGFLDSFF